MGDTCETCRFYKAGSIRRPARCVRFPPQAYRHPPMNWGVRFAFPTIDRKDWCGEWRTLQETKINA